MKTRNFFSKRRAEGFAEELKNSGIKEIRISAALDAFGQTQYRVEWYI